MRCALETTSLCSNGHKGPMWASQPQLRTHSAYVGDFLLATNILLSGNNYTKLALLFRFMRLGMVSQTRFDRIQTLYAIPAIMTYWEQLRSSTVERLRGRPVVLAGKLCTSNLELYFRYLFQKLSIIS